jgi:hypothetical protein
MSITHQHCNYARTARMMHRALALAFGESFQDIPGCHIVTIFSFDHSWLTQGTEIPHRMPDMSHPKHNGVRNDKVVQVPSAHLLPHMRVIELLVQHWEDTTDTESLKGLAC